MHFFSETDKNEDVDRTFTSDPVTSSTMLTTMMDQIKYILEAIDRLTSTLTPAVSIVNTNGEETLTEAQEQVSKICLLMD